MLINSGVFQMEGGCFYSPLFNTLKNIRTSYFLAITWFIITTILLCIPGNSLPKIGWLKILPIDKCVHIFLFGILSLLFCKAFNRRKAFFSIALICSIYGTVMEFVQENWIPNRSFDIWDIVADTMGSFAAVAILHFIYRKEKVVNNISNL